SRYSRSNLRSVLHDKTDRRRHGTRARHRMAAGSPAQRTDRIGITPGIHGISRDASDCAKSLKDSPMSEPVILAVDDDTQVLAAIRRDLRSRYRAHYRVLAANSGEAAIDLLQ